MEADLQGSGPQLTIFYAGRVNVFDHVPARTAQAVMLLLSHDHGSRNREELACPTTSGADSLIQKQQPNYELLKTGAAEQHVKPSCPPPYCPPQSQPFSRPLTPATDDTQIAHSITKKALITSKRLQAAELPFARKKSLARFLERRKDRVLDAMKKNEDACLFTGSGSPCKRIKPC